MVIDSEMTAKIKRALADNKTMEIKNKSTKNKAPVKFNSIFGSLPNMKSLKK